MPSSEWNGAEADENELYFVVLVSGWRAAPTFITSAYQTGGRGHYNLALL